MRDIWSGEDSQCEMLRQEQNWRAQRTYSKPVWPEHRKLSNAANLKILQRAVSGSLVFSGPGTLSGKDPVPGIFADVQLHTINTSHPLVPILHNLWRHGLCVFYKIKLIFKKHWYCFCSFAKYDYIHGVSVRGDLTVTDPQSQDFDAKYCLLAAWRCRAIATYCRRTPFEWRGPRRTDDMAGTTQGTCGIPGVGPHLVTLHLSSWLEGLADPFNSIYFDMLTLEASPVQCTQFPK